MVFLEDECLVHKGYSVENLARLRLIALNRHKQGILLAASLPGANTARAYSCMVSWLLGAVQFGGNSLQQSGALNKIKIPLNNDNIHVAT
jgi:hypothetical protein